MYCVYIRFFPKASWVIMFMPFFYIIKFQFFMPILAGMLLGAAGMIPAAFGCIFYFFMKYTGDYVKLSDTTPSDKIVEGYKYIFEHLVQDKTLLITIIVFAVVIVLTYIIYRMSFAYSWYVAIVTGGVVELILFLVGTLSMDIEISLAGALLGCIIAILVAVVAQFFKTVVDYSSVENTQFEDDEYYYYVKAVPKITSGPKKAVKTQQNPQRPAQRKPASQKNGSAPQRNGAASQRSGSAPQHRKPERRGDSVTGSTR